MSENPEVHIDPWTRDGFPPGDNTVYDPAVYWADVGHAYESYCDLAAYEPQERKLREVLTELLPWSTVLDVGCGFGRLGLVVTEMQPWVRYRGFDISPDQINSARRRHPLAELEVAGIATFKPGETFDLVMCAEVLMHQPPDRIEEAVERMLSWSHGEVVIVEWDDVGYFERTQSKPSTWNFPHDYRKLFGDRLVSETPVGSAYPWSGQTIFVARP